MDNDKKQVIPRSKYGRKRHEYFHNEEREERIERERQKREHLAEKEQHQAKVNEERVKDNLRKARIEKLTQEEIQQQQHLAKLKSKRDASKTAKKNNRHHLTLPEEQHLKQEDIHNEKLKQQKPISSNGSKSENETNKSIEPTYSRLNKNNESRQKSKKEKDNQHNDTIKTQSKHPTITEESYTSTRDKESIHTEKEQMSTQQHSTQVEHTKSEQSKHISNSDKNTTENISDQQPHESHEQSANDTQNKIVDFLKEHWIKILIAIALILILVLVKAIFTEPSQEQHSNQTHTQDKKYTTTMKNANNTVRSVVTVESDAPKNTSVQTTNSKSDNELGSGVVYKTVGDTFFVLTNTHIVGEADKVKITYGENKSIKGDVVGKDKWSDIAVVKAKINNKNIKPIHIGNSNKLVLGESILIVGNPLGEEFRNTVSKGIISGLNRLVPVDFDKDNKNDELMQTFQIDASVNPGHSGGAVVNKDGELIGIVSLKINMPSIEGMGFAIPINEAKSIAKELEKNGKVNYPNTGIALENVNDLNHYERSLLKLPNDINDGILVKKLKDDGLGKKSGLKIGDVIVKLEGKTLKDNLQYRHILFNHRQDLKTLSAKIYRDGNIQDIEINLK
ncbi:trypsin-like peptidase domain-containing protein [Staphylococcus hominis]|uniref:trypsin-like peptidase domain-containing protein n=1 Tax=Staphylococcus hominis TaxID=1290 RepID=UPI000D1F417A|nr:trypsin-like peptidase domain-containing protein [Staphylococcus hominis]MCE4949196.1 trypsin-like peptidase domain-containing protein [Staphylococcus hominis]MCE4951830.1 trypsin-like peptidase domain-containing protein [Staphylococcus hominis]MCE4975891.1 trypsin-like peptidase domain-containing protein [Staphylococcus hominis]PTK22966.1 serine protease [Staphylococcus hominis]PTK26488.1 serine protease [Staphylococcus hominis]